MSSVVFVHALGLHIELVPVYSIWYDDMRLLTTTSAGVYVFFSDPKKHKNGTLETGITRQILGTNVISLHLLHV